MSADYYAVLDVDRDADQAIIKASYRHLAKLHHPDKNPNNLQATTRFQLVNSCCDNHSFHMLSTNKLPFQLNDAYTTLTDPEKRKTYDTQYPSTQTKSRSQNREAGTSKARRSSAGIDE